MLYFIFLYSSFYRYFIVLFEQCILFFNFTFIFYFILFSFHLLYFIWYWVCLTILLICDIIYQTLKKIIATFLCCILFYSLINIFPFTLYSCNCLTFILNVILFLCIFYLYILYIYFFFLRFLIFFIFFNEIIIAFRHTVEAKASFKMLLNILGISLSAET